MILLENERARGVLATPPPALTTTIIRGSNMADLPSPKEVERARSYRPRWPDRTTHGESSSANRRKASRLYGIWASVKARVHRPTSKDYPRYGGRGVTLCPEWERYEGFRDWAMANGYAPDLSIDRRDRDGDYTPENCRWADAITQTRNRSCTLTYTYQGITDVLAAHCERAGLSYSTVHNRLRCRGWSIERALETPATPRSERWKGLP